MVVGRRKSGALRICTDVRQANRAIIMDKYPMPQLEDITVRIKADDAQVFSKVDLKAGYMQLDLAEDARDLTAFITHQGLYRYKRVCFGLSSAPAAFQRALHDITSDLVGTVHILDDILIFSSESDHDERLTALLDRLKERGITVNVDKCEFKKKELDFFGFKINKYGVQPTESHIEAILKIQVPKDVKSLRSFLGATNFLAKFVARYADMTEPLRKLLKTDGIWSWTEECQNAFETLKTAIAKPPVLAHFDPASPTILTTDASAVALGAQLSQLQDGVERPIAFAARSLTETERNYATNEREALAALWAMEKWHFFLYGRAFEVRIDHQSLKQLLSAGGSGHKPLRLHRWCNRLSQYNFSVQHIPGEQNCMADLLSRWSSGAELADRKDEQDIMAVMTRQRISNFEDIKDAMAQEECLQQVLEYVKSDWPPEKHLNEEIRKYFKVRQHLTTWYGGMCLAFLDRTVVPKVLRQQVLHKAHVGHQGIVRTKQQLRAAVWWPGMDSDVEQLVKHCTACLMAEKNFTVKPAPLQTPKWPTRPWTTIAVDIVGELIAAPATSRFLFVVTDWHSKWPEVVETSSITTEVICTALKTMFSRYGIPEKCVSDNGPQFGQRFTDFLSERGVEHSKTAFYAPHANGQTERFNRTLMGCVKASINEGKSFSDAVLDTLLAYRTTPHPLTGKSPAELMFGRPLRSPVQAYKQLQPLSTAEAAIQRRVTTKQNQSNTYTDEKRGAAFGNLQPGDYVRPMRPQRNHKLASRLGKQLRIVKKIGNCSYALSDGSRWNQRRLVADNTGIAGASDTDDDSVEHTNVPTQDTERTLPRRSERMTKIPTRYPN